MHGEEGHQRKQDLLLKACKYQGGCVARWQWRWHCRSSSEEEEVPGMPSTPSTALPRPRASGGAAEETSPVRDAAKPRAIPASPGPGLPSHSLLEITGEPGGVGGLGPGWPPPCRSPACFPVQVLGREPRAEKGLYGPKHAASSAQARRGGVQDQA